MAVRGYNVVRKGTYWRESVYVYLCMQGERERETYVGLMSRVVGAKCADALSTDKVMESAP